MNGVRAAETAASRRWLRWGAASILLWGAFLAAPPLCRADITTGLVGYWMLNEGSGTTANDTSGQGNNGTLQSGAGWATGKTGVNVLHLSSAASQYVSVPNTGGALNVNTGVTVAGWIQLNNVAVSGQTFFQIFSKVLDAAIPDRAYHLRLEGATNTGLYGDLSVFQSGVSHNISSTTPLPVGVWLHIVGTYDGSSQALYVNGVMNSSAPLTGTISQQTGNAYIGSLDGTLEFFNGLISEVRVYNRGLTAADVQQLYQVTQSLPPGCGSGSNVKKDGTQDTTTISQAVSAIPPSLSTTTCIVIRDTQTYSEQVAVQGVTSNNNQIKIMADPSFISSAPVVSPPANSTAAFQIMNTSVTLQQINIIPANSTSYGVWVSSSNAAISSVSVVDAAGKIAAAGIWLSAANGGSVSNSTASVSASSADAIALSSASSNAIIQSYFFSSGNHSARLDYSNNNTISQSTITSASNAYAAFLVNAASNNNITQNYVAGTNHIGLGLSNGAFGNTVSFCTIAGNIDGAYMGAVSSNTISDSFISMPYPGGNNGLEFEGSTYNSVLRSTITSVGMTVAPEGSNGGIFIKYSSATTVSNVYVQASTAVWVAGSTGTIIQMSSLQATNAAGAALYISRQAYGLGSGALNLTVSGNAIAGGPQGAAIYVDGNNFGVMTLSSNSISGSHYDVLVETQSAGAQVWITSNTINPTLLSATDSFGIFLFGLNTGATVQNNSIFYTAPGATLFPAHAAWLYAYNSSGLIIDHNRFSNPGMIAGGTFFGLWLGTDNSDAITFNDFYSTGGALTNFIMLHLDAAPNTTVKNNIFFTSMTGSTATVEIDLGTPVGLNSDYNDFFAANGPITLTNVPVDYQSLAAWTAATGQDSHSISADPLYANAANGDFHVKSQTGRLSGGSFVTDPVTSPTIDAADPAAAFTLEPAPNGGRANMGSYGNTPNASKTFTSLPPSSPAIGAVYLSSVTVTYGTVGAPGYVVDASTASNFTGTLFSSSTLSGVQSSLSPQNLISNTTYFFRAGAIYGGGTTVYANTVPASTMTFASSPTPLSFTGIAALQFTVDWPANGNPAWTQYAVQVSTDINFSIVKATAGTASLNATFSSGLTPNATYFVRVQAFNAAGTPTPYALGVVLTVTGIITISANRLPGVWYRGGSAIFFAQGATNYNYRISAIALDTPSGTDPLFDGSGLTLPVPNGAQYFHVLGVGGAGNGQVAHFGPIDIDTGTPIVASISAQNSATDPTLIANGGTTLAVTPRFFWPAAVSLSPVVGYSLSLSTDPAAVPGSGITTTITFSDQVLVKSGTYYAKVSALNLAGTLSPPASMNFTFTTTPSLNNIVLKNNLINPLRGGCAEIDVQLAAAGRLKVQLYNLLGQRVTSLADDDVTPAVYIYNWCGRNSTNELVASGVYLLRIEAPGEKKTLRVGVLK